MSEWLLPDALKLDLSRVGLPAAVALALGVLVVVLAYTVGLRWHQRLSMPRRVFLLALRLGAIAVLVFALLHPVWNRSEERAVLPVVAVVLDDSRSMSRPYAEGPGAAAGPTRYAKAREVLQQEIEPALRGTHQVQVFDVRGARLDPAALPAAPQAPASPIVDGLVNIERALSGEPLQAVLLLSDGIESRDRPSVAGIDRLRVPVYPIEVAQPRPGTLGPPDLVVQSVATNRTALVGNTVRVTIDVAATGETSSARVPISILDGEQIVASSTVAWRPDQPLVRTQLDFVPLRPGLFQYLVQLGTVPGEVNLENNRRTFTLAVRSKALKVLYVDGVLRWEGKFIREAMSTDPDISVVFVVRTAPPGSDSGSHGLLLSDALAKVDMVILGDVEATYFSAREIDALCAWVTEKRGALMLTGGYNSFGPKGFGQTKLQEILPVHFSSAPNPQVEQPFSLLLTPAGEESPIFDLTGNRTHDAAFYHMLPQLGGCSLVAGVKPGAQVLAIDPLVRDPKTNGPLPVMVVQQVGSGRTLVFTVDTTWRWRMVVGGFTGDTTFYQKFWGQLVRWMTGEGEQAPQQLAVATDRFRYQPDQPVRLNIQVTAAPSPAVKTTASKGTAAGKPGAASSQGTLSPHAWRVTALAMHEAGRKVTVPLAELPGARYEGSFTANLPGRWDVAVTADPAVAPADKEAAARQGGQSQVVTVAVNRADQETLDVQPRRQWLEQLAAQTGGRRIQPGADTAWLRELPGAPAMASQVESIELWRHPGLAGLFFTLLCTEWILRRRRRLP